MKNVETRASLALQSKAMQLMDIEGRNRNILLLKSATEVHVDIYMDKYLNDYFGFFPNGRNKNQVVKSVFGTEAIEGLAYLCFEIVSSVGYNQFKPKSAKDLKSMLGNKYKLILEAAERNGLIKLRKTPTVYSSPNRDCFHTEILVIGRSGSFKRKPIKNEIARSRIKKYRLSKLKEPAKEALETTYRNQKDLVIYADGFEVQNLGLEHGFFMPKLDTFGRRIHSFITNLDKEKRQLLRNIYHLDQKLVEADVSQSHPQKVFRLYTNPYCLIYAFSEHEVRRLFSSILDDHYIDDELLFDMELNLDKGTFYNEFFFYLLEDSINDWRKFILDKHLKENPEDKNRKFTDLVLCKIAFMYVINGGAKPILKALESNERYHGFVSLILILQKTWIPKGSKEIKNLKKPYSPHKNLAMILQRIESHAMQTAFNSLNGVWGLLLHDSIVCMDKDKEAVKQAIEVAYLALDLGFPIVKFK